MCHTSLTSLKTLIKGHCKVGKALGQMFRNSLLLENEAKNYFLER